VQRATATATSFSRQNPEARRRCAWWRPPTGTKAWATAAVATASTAAAVAPATSRAAPSMPGNGRLSPTSPKRTASTCSRVPAAMAAGSPEKRAIASR